MGNQLVTTAAVKTMIRPIDYYLVEVPDIKHKTTLGQRQFLKVFHCTRGAEGEVILKILSHEDQSLLLESYKHEMLSFGKITANNPSIASFKVVELRPTFAYMIRQYVRYSLYDRLSTRPFLTDIEKCWIVYQILQCMSWCHGQRLYHGDIKLENIMITSNSWVIITDFAPYKPVNLPEDNPSVFNYFFDNSRRRCCNIAPERFVPSASMNQMDPPAATLHANSSTASLSSLAQEAQLTDKMDMFSIGCTLAEIFFSDSSIEMLFDLSEILAYKMESAGSKEHLEQALKKIDNAVIRELVLNLICLDPNERKSCDTILEELQGVLFPHYFDKLYHIMKILIRLQPDFKVLYLMREMNNYLPEILEENPSGVLILLMTLTSTLRNLKHSYAKIQAQHLICHYVECAAHCLSPFIIDRLIPYFAHLLAHDEDHRVRGEAIHSLTRLLEQVETIPGSDSNIFTDFLMPILCKSLEAEKYVYVRLCMAQNVGRLAQVSLHFLNQFCDQNYDEELSLLHSSFASLVLNLLTDSNNCVRRTLLLTVENCANLCTFFGRQKTNDVILPHIFTFLNHKSDFQLRLSFFDNVITIASYLGVQCSPILLPLLQQGLCDAEEIIIAKTINSIASLAEQGLLQKNVIYDLLKEILPLLYHPNQWIVHSIIHLFTTLSEHLSAIDVHCKVIPMLSPFLNRKIHSLSNKCLLRDSLKSPLTREVYNIVMESKDEHILQVFYQILRNQTLGTSNVPYRRLVAEISPDAALTVETQLLLLSDLFSKIYRNRRTYLVDGNRENDDNYILTLPPDKYIYSSTLNDLPSKDEKFQDNQEWEQMFGPRSAATTLDSATDASAMVSTAIEAKEMEFPILECPPSIRALKQYLVHKRRKLHFKSAFDQPVAFSSNTFRPRGILVSHLYEHKSSVNQLALYKKDPNSFFSCSDDGTIRFWDLTTFDNRNVINRSKYVFRMEFIQTNSLVNFKGIVNCGKYVITYSSDGTIYVFEITDTCLSLVCSFKPGSSNSSVEIIITSICALNSNIFVVSLTNSVMYGYDVRQLEDTSFFVPVFKMQIRANLRNITSIDGSGVVLYAATAYGIFAGFDLRFNLHVLDFRHDPNGGARVARIRYTPEGLYSSTYGTSNVTLWDHKDGQKIKELRACNSEADKSTSAVHAILPISSPFMPCSSLITAGTDRRIRYWDINEPEQSYVISDPLFKACSGLHNNRQSNNNVRAGNQPNYFDASISTPPLATYISRASRVADFHYIQELDASAAFGQFQNTHFCSLDHESIKACHEDTITDLLRVNQYLVSAGRNGSVKVWR